MTDHHAAFLALIAAEPYNPAPKLIYADWLEERGDPACEAWRWIVQNDLRPDEQGWMWGCCEKYNPRACVPDEVFDSLPAAAKQWGHYIPECDHYQELVAAFLVARQAGWRPE